LSKALREEYKFNLAELARKDKERVLLEEAKNHLESYIYKVKNKLVDDEEKVALVSTEEQRQELNKLAMEAEDWLFDEGDTADLKTIKAKYDELTAPAEKVWFRLAESTARPEAVQNLKDKLKEFEEKFNMWLEGKDHITDDEKSVLASKVEGARKWLADKEAEQATKAGHEDPAFTSSEVPLQMHPILKLATRLQKKPKPKVEKNETVDKADNETTVETNETTTAEEHIINGTEKEKVNEVENETDSNNKLDGEEL
jgi:hypoxia up-regulated 1